MWRRGSACATCVAALATTAAAGNPSVVAGNSKLRRFSTTNRDDRDQDQDRRKQWATAAGAAGLVLIAGGSTLWLRRRIAHAADAGSSPNASRTLPVYSRADVREHGRTASRIWVTFGKGVYDITDFVESHPGGDKILMAAGGAVEPFWDLYAQHKTKEVLEILEEMRIGNLDPKEDAPDAFSGDPKRHPALIVNNEKPFNAETPPQLLLDAFNTPNDLFFVRNHLPVPKTDILTHRLRVEGLGTTSTVTLSVQDLKRRFVPVSVSSAVQCAGNRRAEMNRFKKVQGLMWQGTAISNAKWTGARLRDVLIMAGVNPNDPNIKHVHFEGADVDPTGMSSGYTVAHADSGQPYGASIPFEKAMSPEVIIAYQMNGEEIPRDHGYPLRVIVPGIVGARQVKWVTVIRTSSEESPSHWQQKDYRAFSPSVGLGDPLDFSTVPAIQEYPVQSAFASPADGATVRRDDGEIEVSGYAWSGGGRGIIRVEISADGGKTWQSAQLQQDPEQKMDRMWAWTQWRARIAIPPSAGINELQLVCKATDRAYNTQPETPAGIWNVRGLLNTAWHRVTVKIRD